MDAKLLGQRSSARGEDIHILSHARLIDVSIDRLRPEQNRVCTMTQKFQHRIVNLRQRQRLFHREFPKRERAVTKHTSSIACDPPYSRPSRIFLADSTARGIILAT